LRLTRVAPESGPKPDTFEAHGALSLQSWESPTWMDNGKFAFHLPPESIHDAVLITTCDSWFPVVPRSTANHGFANAVLEKGESTHAAWPD
jgi:hypothetical protein